MVDEPISAKPVRVFLGDSVPTAHLQKVVEAAFVRTAPTGHLPISPRIGSPGASVPTGHLPSTVPPSVATPPPAGSGEKK